MGVSPFVPPLSFRDQSADWSWESVFAGGDLPPAGALLKFIVDVYNIQFHREMACIYACIPGLSANTGGYSNFKIFC